MNCHAELLDDVLEDDRNGACEFIPHDFDVILVLVDIFPHGMADLEELEALSQLALGCGNVSWQEEPPEHSPRL